MNNKTKNIMNLHKTLKIIYQHLFYERRLYFVKNIPEYKYEFDLRTSITNLVLLVVSPAICIFFYQVARLFCNLG